MRYIQKGIEVLVVIGVLVGCYLIMNLNYKNSIKQCVNAGYEEAYCVRGARE